MFLVEGVSLFPGDTPLDRSVSGGVLLSHVYDLGPGVLLDRFDSVHASFLRFVPLTRSYLFTV